MIFVAYLPFNTSWILRQVVQPVGSVQLEELQREKASDIIRVTRFMKNMKMNSFTFFSLSLFIILVSLLTFDTVSLKIQLGV